MHFTDDELNTCLRVLQVIADDPAMMQEHERFKSLVAKIHKTGKQEQRRAAQQRRNSADRAVKEAALLVRRQNGDAHAALQDESIAPTGTLHTPRPCYICKQPYTQIHAFYHLLCPACAALNYQKRFQRADLAGRIALITGGRIKIGHQTALRLLRDGARVIVSTRFPHDAARRFASEPDFADWCDRLRIYGLDLRHIPSVEAFAQHIRATEPALDILINNAAQTVKRPMAFFEHLLLQELQPRDTLPEDMRRLLPDIDLSPTLLLEQLPDYRGHLPDSRAYFPAGLFDADGQQLDMRPSNSWVLRLDQISTVELLEVQLVNAVAPFILANQLKPLLLRSRFDRRFVINVSAMEGQFARADKTIFHPHTNMAKAALNMLTRTAAADYARDGIYMNSVDTGWVTDENPFDKRVYAQQSRGFYAPLDSIDGMARIYDPIVQGVADQSEPVYGQFLKDYHPYPW